MSLKSQITPHPSIIFIPIPGCLAYYYSQNYIMLARGWRHKIRFQTTPLVWCGLGSTHHHTRDVVAGFRSTCNEVKTGMAEIVRPRETKIDVGDRACRGEKETLRVLFGDLVESIDTAILLPAALSSSLISEQQRSDCASEADPYKKAEKLLTYLQRSVNGDSNKFHTFVKILRETNQETIAVRLQGMINEVCWHDIAEPASDVVLAILDNLDMVTRQIASNPEGNVWYCTH